MGQACSVGERQVKTDKRNSKGNKSMYRGGTFQVAGLNDTSFQEEYQTGQVHSEKVLVARNKLTKRVDVVYQLPKAMSPCIDGQEIGQVIKAMMGVEHPNICRLIEAFDDPAFVFVVVAKVEGMVLAQSIQKTGLNERRVSDIGFQIVRGLSVCAALQPPVYHGALSPKNVMIDPHGTVLINDMGLIEVLKPGPMQKLQKETFAYMAPEVVEAWVSRQDSKQSASRQESKDGARTSQVMRQRKTAAADLWSLGVIIFQMMSGKLPFHGKTLQEIGQKITTTQPQFMKKLENVNKEGVDLVMSLMNTSPQRRPRCKDLLSNRWLSDAFREELSMEPFDPEVASNFMSVHCETNFKKAMMRLMSEKLPPSKIKKLESTFNAMDKNHDGMVSLKELKEFLKTHPDISTDGDLEKMWEDMDSDQSGAISIHEFVAATLDTQGVMVHDVLWKTFSALDTNHNGRLTKLEIKAALKELNMRLGAEHIAAINNLVDGELGAEEITFQDFCALMHEEGARDRRSGGCCCCSVSRN